MVQKALDTTSTSSDFYTIFDKVVATNPHLNQRFIDISNETNLFLCKVLRFYNYRDLAYVELLTDGSKHYCHMTHEMLSYEMSLNCMCDGFVESDTKYGSYVRPYNDVYGVVANVRFKGNSDEKCLLCCLNYEGNGNLQSSVRNGEIKLNVEESSISITRNRINLMTPTLLVNGLPYNEPKLSNYYDKQEVSTTISLLKEDLEAQIREVENAIANQSADELWINRALEHIVDNWDDYE